MRRNHHGSFTFPKHADASTSFPDAGFSKLFKDAFLEANGSNSMGFTNSDVSSFYSWLLSSANIGHDPVSLTSAPNSALHYFPNAPVASLYTTRPREDKLFEAIHTTHNGNEGPSIKANASCTPLEAVKALPALLREIATYEETQRKPQPNQRARDPLAVGRHAKGEAASREPQTRPSSGINPWGPGHPGFLRSVLEQCFLGLYLQPILNTPERTRSGVASFLPRNRTDGALFYAHLYSYCGYAELPEVLRIPLERFLAVVLVSSAFSFHVGWSWLVSRGHRGLALELFMLWGWANPDGILLEQAQRLLPTTYDPRQGHICPGEENPTLTGLWDIALQLFSHTTQMTSAERRAAQLRGGFLTSSLMYPKGYREALAVKMGAQLPYKKYYVTCALLTQVLKEAACVSDTAFSTRQRESSDPCTARGRREIRGSQPPSQDRGAEIFTALMREWVFPVLCSSTRTLPPIKDPSSTSPSLEFSPAVIGYDPYTERYEEWIVLACTVAAVGLLERYMIETRRAPAARAPARTEDPLSPEGASLNPGDPPNDPPSPHFESHPSIDALRAASLAWAWGLVSQDLAADADEAELRHARAHVENWARMIFSAVLDAFEASGVLHPARTRRPITACGLWARLHAVLLAKFPHVFHGGSTVATLWVLMVLEGMSTDLPGGPLAVSFFGKEEALAAWRRLARLPGPTTGDPRGRPGGGFPEGPSQPLAEHQRRVEFLQSELASADEPVGKGDARAAATPAGAARRANRAIGFAGPPPSFASNPLLWVSHSTRGGLAEGGAVAALREAEAAALGVFRQHVGLPVLRPLPPRAEKGRVRAFSPGIAPAAELAGIAQGAACPSFYVLLKLMQVLTVWGQPGAEGDPREGALAPLWMALLEENFVGACAPIMGRYLRRLGLLGLVHSGARGARALVWTYAHALAILGSPEVSWDRLLQAVLWSTWPADAPERLWRWDAQEEDPTEEKARAPTSEERPSPYGLSFGSNSLGWRVLEAWITSLRWPPPGESASEGNPPGLTPSEDAKSAKRMGKLMRHVLSFLDTLSFHIPDEARCAVSIFPTLHNATLWGLVEDCSARQAAANASPPMDSARDLIQHFITTLSSSLQHGAVNPPHFADRPSEADPSGALAEDTCGDQPPPPASHAEDDEDADSYDSGEAVWWNELEAAATLHWEANTPQASHADPSTPPSERDRPPNSAMPTSFSPPNRPGGPRKAADGDWSPTGASRIATPGEFDAAPEIRPDARQTPSDPPAGEPDGGDRADSLLPEADEVLACTKALRMVLQRTSPAAFHLLFSFLELVGWVLGLPVSAVRWAPSAEPAGGLLSSAPDFAAAAATRQWVPTLVLGYTALLRVFSPLPSPGGDFPLC
ncbi:unnamed protein product [Phytomonas sp. Hart1]|nr:unnamed protein product [Phytomonas sp. Hart1]|eukprot:CCW66183.1 unnamed protein product [Phytomonas sp. isolate Hart1]